jgi:hypothetical protein
MKIKILDNINVFQLKGFRTENLRPFVKTRFCDNFPENRYEKEFLQIRHGFCSQSFSIKFHNLSSSHGALIIIIIIIISAND